MGKKQLTQEQEYGNDALFLYDKGFDITCLDKSKEAKKYIEEANQNIKVITETFENFILEKNEVKYDLIYSNFGIIFCNKDYIDELIYKIKNSLNTNGFFVGNFLGITDDWNDESHKEIKFFNKDEIMNYFKEFKVFYISDKRYIKDSSKEKDKHWHVIEIYAQKNINN